MCENIINLSKKYFIIITPNRFHPIDFHTKIPFFTLVTKKIHRILCHYLVLNSYQREKFELLSYNDLFLIMKKLNHNNFTIKSINFLLFKSNLILIGNKN